MRSRSYTLIPTNSNSHMIAQATASHQLRQGASELAAFVTGAQFVIDGNSMLGQAA
jgi:hypothetical protein